MRTLTHAATLAVSLCLAVTIAAGGEPLVPTRTASTLTAPTAPTPTIDGKLDDKTWAKAQPMKIFSYINKGVRSKTDAWICRDARNIYLAARCYDDNLDELVTENEGAMMWKNDCLEIFIVPEKNLDLWTKLLVTCDGRTQGSLWVLDEWGEAVQGKPLKMAARTGREKDAWTVELAMPIKAFGLKLSKDKPWSFGLNREKWSGMAEVSSYMGGFNKPKQYPDLVFENRPIVLDGIGVKNISDKPQKVEITLSCGDTNVTLFRTISPGKTGNVDAKRMELLSDHAEGAEFRMTVSDPTNKIIVSETYKLVPAAKKLAKIDPKKLPVPKFRPSPMDDPKFFPVAVWLQPAGAKTLADYKELGVNVYFGGIDSYPRPKDKEWLDAVQAAGMYAVIPFKQKYVENELYKHPAVIGWHHADEPDLPQTALNGKPIPAKALMSDFLKARAIKPNLRVFLNLSQGVANDRYIGRAVPYSAYPDYCATADVIQYDIYPCNSLGKTGPDRFRVIAKGLDRLKKWSGGRAMLGFAIETNRFTKTAVTDSRSPTPEEFKTQAWMAVVHGARTINLFCHSWYGKGMKVDGITPEMRAALKPIIAEFHQLAEVINSPTISDAPAGGVSKGGRVSTLVKKHGNATYVFAVNMYRKAEKPTITVKGVADGEAEVLFENRTVKVTGGKIVDDFAPYAVHRYKIAG